MQLNRQELHLIYQLAKAEWQRLLPADKKGAIGKELSNLFVKVKEEIDQRDEGIKNIFN